MTNKKKSISATLNRYDVEKDVACIAQVEEVVSKSDIELTDSCALMLKLLRFPNINLVLSARLVECISMFSDDVNEFLDTHAYP